MTDGAAQLIEAARRRLAAAPQEALGVVEEPGRLRRALGGGPRIVRAGSAWHVGVLLIGGDAVAAVGEILRAADPGRRGYAAESARRRAELRAMALRGGFDEGETVHLGWTSLDLAAASSGPLVLDRGAPLIRWTPSGSLMPLETYLAERVALLLAPPPGA